MTAPLIVITYAEDVSDGPTLRLSVRGKAGVEALDAVFAEHRASGSSVRLSETRDVASEAGADLVLAPVGSGKRYLVRRRGSAVFDLGGTPDDWEARLHLIRSLDRPGFQYLDYETPGAVVLLVEWLDS